MSKEVSTLAAILLSKLQLADSAADQSPRGVCGLLETLAEALAGADCIFASNLQFVSHCLQRVDNSLNMLSRKSGE